MEFDEILLRRWMEEEEVLRVVSAIGF